MHKVVAVAGLGLGSAREGGAEEVGSIAHQSVKLALQSHSSNWVRVSRDVAPGVAASQSPWHLFLHQKAIKKSQKNRCQLQLQKLERQLTKAGF